LIETASPTHGESLRIQGHHEAAAATSEGDLRSTRPLAFGDMFGHLFFRTESTSKATCRVSVKPLSSVVVTSMICLAVALIFAAVIFHNTLPPASTIMSASEAKRLLSVEFEDEGAYFRAVDGIIFDVWPYDSTRPTSSGSLETISFSKRHNKSSNTHMEMERCRSELGALCALLLIFVVALNATQEVVTKCSESSKTEKSFEKDLHESKLKAGKIRDECTCQRETPYLSRSKLRVGFVTKHSILLAIFIFAASLPAANSTVCGPTGAVTTLAGSGSQGYADGTGAAALFNDPFGVAFSPDQTMIAVADTNNCRIRLLVVATGAVSTLAGSGSQGYADGTGVAASFNEMRGVAFSPDQTMIAVADTNNRRIRLVVVATGAVSTLAGSGVHGYADGTGVAASFNDPFGVAFSPDQSMIAVADAENNRIRLVVVATGAVSTLAGSGSQGYADGTGAAASFNSPSGVAFSPDQTMIAVVDFKNHCIRRVCTASTAAPTAAPTDAPTDVPTAAPTAAPTDAPTDALTDAPTDVPTAAPTATPTDAPTDTLTDATTDVPTAAPTAVPTDAPTDAPTAYPTLKGYFTVVVEKEVTIVATTLSFPLTAAEAANPAMQASLAEGMAASLGLETDAVSITHINGVAVPRRRLEGHAARKLAVAEITFAIQSPTSESRLVDELKSVVADVATSGLLVKNIQKKAAANGMLVAALQSMESALPTPVVEASREIVTVTESILVEENTSSTSNTTSVLSRGHAVLSRGHATVVDFVVVVMSCSAVWAGAWGA
jgi:DNA-binding beta-propeller fold protein YncE